MASSDSAARVDPAHADLPKVDPAKASSPKVDFKKTLDCYRAVRDQFTIIDVPTMRFLKVDGHGDPNTSPEYTAAIEALYPVAYRLKFASKKEFGRDYVIPPLEGLWWADDMRHFTSARDKTRWHWTVMLMTPDWIGPDLVDSVIAGMAASTRTAPPARLDDLRWESMEEGRCVQTMHVGPCDEEGPLLARMHEDFIPAHGLRMTGSHHEIYLSDPRRAAPENLRTILRQPVA